jgi:hypothetical protein
MKNSQDLVKGLYILNIIISLHGDAILKKLKIRLNACIIILLLLYLIGVIFSVNLKFYGQNSCVNLIKEVNFSKEFLIF